jgi:transposase
MINLSGNPRLFLCQYPVSMRKSFEGLSAQVELLFPGELLSGAFFVFLNKQQDHMKVLYWDTDGLAIWFKRLEKGSFSRKNLDQSTMNRREFLMPLEGIRPKRLQPRFSL